MAEDRISSVILKEAIEKERVYLNGVFDEWSSKIKAFGGTRISLQGADSIKDLYIATNQFSKAQTDLSSITQIATERLAKFNGQSKELTSVILLEAKASREVEAAKLNEAKARATNATAAEKEAAAGVNKAKENAINIQSLIAQRKETERLIAVEEKRKAISEKNNAAAEAEAGREKILLLRQQQEAEEKLLEAEKNRIAAEEQHLSGNFNPGGGKGNAPVTTPLNLSVGQGNIALVKSYEAEIAKLTQEQKNALDAFNKGTLSQNAYKTILVQNTEKINGYKKSVSDLNKEIGLSNAVNESERNSLGRAQALIAQYTNEKKKLNLATDDGRRLNENYNKAIAASNAFILKNADAETVRAKGIGQYTQGINKAFSGLRTLANIIPGLGLGGIFLIALGPVISFVEAIGKLIFGVSAAKEAQKELNKTIGESVASTASEVVQLQAKLSVAKDIKNSDTERLQAIKDLNTSYPQLLGNLTLENIGTKEVTKSINDQIAAIKAVAKQKALSSLVDTTAVKLEQAEQKLKNTKVGIFTGGSKLAEAATEVQNLRTQLDIYTKALFGNTVETELNSKAVDKNKKTIKEKPGEDGKFGRLKELDDGIAELKKQRDLRSSTAKEIKAFDDDIAKLQKERDIIDPDGAKKIREKAQHKDSLQALKEVKDNEFEIYKIAQEAKIRLYEADIRSDEVHYLDKLRALDNFVIAQRELLDRQEAEDIANKKREAAREIQHLNEEKPGKSGSEKARINENIKIVEENLQKDLLLIQSNYADKGIQLVENASDRRHKIVDDQLKKDKDSYEAYAKQEQDAIDRSNERIKAGFKKRADQEKEFAQKSLEIEKELNDKKVDLALKVENVYEAIQDGVYERQLNVIKSQKDDIDIRKERALAANDAIVQSEQDKAANIAIINSRAQVDKEVLDRKAKDIQHKQDVFNRAQQAFEIAIGTVKAVAAINFKAAELRAAAALNPLLAPLIGLVLAQIPITIATGAASVAALFAKPLPKYKGGRGQGKAEFAIVGDGGKREPIIRENGHIELSPATSTITYLNKKDIVLPDVTSLARLMARINVTPTNLMAQNLINSLNPWGMIMQAQGRIQQQQNGQDKYEDFWGEKSYSNGKSQLRTLERIEGAIRNQKTELPIELSPYYQHHIKY